MKKICNKCKKEIEENELYFCNSLQIESHCDNIITVTDAIETEILCLNCARKQDKLKYLDSSDEAKKQLGLYIKTEKRNLRETQRPLPNSIRRGGMS